MTSYPDTPDFILIDPTGKLTHKERSEAAKLAWVTRRANNKVDAVSPQRLMAREHRKAAFASGAITYLGQPCRNCGCRERRTISKKCIECDRFQKRVDAASGYSNAYHAWWRRTRDPHRIRQRRWEATYRTRHALQLERKARERKAVRWNTINLLYGGVTDEEYCD